MSVPITSVLAYNGNTHMFGWYLGFAIGSVIITVIARYTAGWLVIGTAVPAARGAGTQTSATCSTPSVDV